MLSSSSREPVASSKIQSQHQLPWDAVLVPSRWSRSQPLWLPWDAILVSSRWSRSQPLCSPSAIHPFIFKLGKGCEMTITVGSPEQALSEYWRFPHSLITLCARRGALLDSLAEVQGYSRLLACTSPWWGLWFQVTIGSLSASGPSSWPWPRSSSPTCVQSQIPAPKTWT